MPVQEPGTRPARALPYVLGVSARPSEALLFGNTATRVLVGWDKPVLFLASRPQENRHEPGEAKANPAAA